MKNFRTILLALPLVISSTCFTPSFAQSEKNKMSSGYAPVNGLKMYYEIHGSGKPIVLLHGAYMTIDLNYKELIAELSKSRQVIATELQGHGHTNDIDRPFSYDAMANDVAALMTHLKIDNADVLGYSLGGTVAIQLAIQNPQKVNNLILVSTVFRYSGWLPQVGEILTTIKPELFEATPLKTSYDKVAPDPKHWNDFVRKLAEFDMKDYDLGAENFANIHAPILFIMGDNDGVDLMHKAEMYKLSGGNIFGDMAGLPKSQLAIFPASSHTGLMMQTKAILEVLEPFLMGSHQPCNIERTLQSTALLPNMISFFASDFVARVGSVLAQAPLRQ